MSVFICSLGIMGRRHLIGALQAGLAVVAYDPSEDSITKSKEAIEKSGLANSSVQFLKQFPEQQGFDIAIFAETADFRKDNFIRFTQKNKAKRIMLEKPVARSQSDFDQVAKVAYELKISGVEIFVNFPRRTWPFYMNLKETWGSSSPIEMTVNGGAIGLGCNGIHYIDTFCYLTSSDITPFEVAYSQVDADLVGSGRGARFKDYGGTFLIKKGKSSLYLSLNPTGTSTPILSLKTLHSTLWIDESNYTYREWKKTGGFDKPNYLYGQDYTIRGEGPVAYRDLISLTKLWVQQELILPTIEQVGESHSILFSLLKAAQVPQPFLFT